MNIKYNKHKQELRDDPIMDGLIQAKEFILKNMNSIIGTIVVVVVVVVGFSVFSYMHKSSIQKASDSFGDAMLAYNDQQYDKAIQLFRIVDENHHRTPQGIQSAFLIGSILLKEGKYDEAITWFESSASASNASSGFIRGESFEGIASCYEAKGNVKSALEYLDKALTDQNIKYRFPAIKWKMALLNRSIDADNTRKLCREIMSDTTATDYRQKAENLLSEIDVVPAS